VVRAAGPGICQAKASGRPQCGGAFGLWDIAIARWRGMNSRPNRGVAAFGSARWTSIFLAFALSRAEEQAMRIKVYKKRGRP
jgi:hypothetical protein